MGEFENTNPNGPFCERRATNSIFAVADVGKNKAKRRFQRSGPEAFKASLKIRAQWARIPGAKKRNAKSSIVAV
jgi:hypothetical protein